MLHRPLHPAWRRAASIFRRRVGALRPACCNEVRTRRPEIETGSEHWGPRTFRLDGANPFWRMILQRKGSFLPQPGGIDAMPNLKSSKTHENLKFCLRRREPGQPALPPSTSPSRRTWRAVRTSPASSADKRPRARRPCARPTSSTCRTWANPPATGEPIGDTEKNLKAAVAGETYEYTQMYPRVRPPGARGRVRGESPSGSRRWPRRRKSHAGRFAKGLQQVNAPKANPLRVHEGHRD